MNATQKSAALQLFALTYMIACIVGLVLQSNWGLIMAIAIGAFLALCFAGFIAWAIYDLVRALITGQER